MSRPASTDTPIMQARPAALTIPRTSSFVIALLIAFVFVSDGSAQIKLPDWLRKVPVAGISEAEAGQGIKEALAGWLDVALARERAVRDVLLTLPLDSNVAVPLIRRAIREEESARSQIVDSRDLLRKLLVVMGGTTTSSAGDGDANPAAEREGTRRGVHEPDRPRPSSQE